LKPFGNTVAGAVIGGASAVAGEFALAAGGLSSAGVGVGGGTLTLTETFVAGGTASGISGFYWRQGFNGLFPEYVDPPSVETVTFDYASGGTLGLGGRFIEAVGNPFSRAGWDTIRLTTAEASTPS
jgi:hypothetical protein